MAALRRQSYDLNEENLFNVEYADVLGIPFDFTAKPVVAPPHFQKVASHGGESQLHLFGQLRRIARQWLDNCLVCKGGAYPAQLMYQELADMACERITAGIVRAEIGNRPIKAVLDIQTGEREEAAFREGRSEAKMNPILQKALRFCLQAQDIERMSSL